MDLWSDRQADRLTDTDWLKTQSSAIDKFICNKVEYYMRLKKLKNLLELKSEEKKSFVERTKEAILTENRVSKSWLILGHLP